MSTTRKIQKEIEASQIETLEVPLTKVNPFTLKVPEAKAITKEFTDESNPDVKLILKLKRLDPAEAAACLEMAEVYCNDYIGTPDGPTPTPLMVGTKRIVMSKALIHFAIMLNAMQVTPPKGTPYSIEDFLAISVTMPEAWGQMLVTLDELYKKESKKGS